MMRIGHWWGADVAITTASGSLCSSTARYLGTFLADPLDVPRAVVDYLSRQLEVADPSCVKRYTERGKTRFEHMWEIRARYDLREFAEAEASLVAWVDARSWTTGDGPKAVFADAVLWLRERCRVS